MATDWLTHFIVRQLIYWVFAIVQTITRRKYEENELGFAVIIGITILIAVEASVYKNYR